MITKKIQATRQDEAGFDWNGKHYYDHIITVDGVDYHYSSLKKDLVDFEAGKEATFTTGEKIQKNNKTRLTISPVKDSPGKTFGGFGGGKGAYSKDDGVITMLSCISSAATYGNALNWEQVLVNAQKAYELAKSKRGDFK